MAPSLAPALLLLTTAAAAQPQDRNGSAATRTVWDGVYTEAQAGRGSALYETTCRSCHRGGPRKEGEFMRDWSGSDVQSLFRQIQASMPPGAPSSLSDAAYADIVAYVLQVNAFPAGGREFDAAAGGPIRIEGRNGSEPVPDFSLVLVVGCLSQESDMAWRMDAAGEPIRTKNPAASGDGENRESAAPPGTRSFRLLNVYPAPDALRGHRVEARGFLIRDPGGDRINVTSVRTLAPVCGAAR